MTKSNSRISTVYTLEPTTPSDIPCRRIDGIWEERLGDTWEQMTNTSDLERQFQEWKAAQ